MRHALRLAIKHRGYSALAALTLALGIGANTAVFSLADLFLFRPLPFEDVDRLVMVLETCPRNGSGWNDVSPANFFDWRRMSTSFERLAATTGKP